MSAIFRKKDFSIFNYVIMANSGNVWCKYVIGHGEGVCGWNYGVSYFFLPKLNVKVAVVFGYRSFPKYDFELDSKEEREFSDSYWNLSSKQEAWEKPEIRHEMIVDFLTKQIEEFQRRK